MVVAPGLGSSHSSPDPSCTIDNVDNRTTMMMISKTAYGARIPGRTIEVVHPGPDTGMKASRHSVGWGRRVCWVYRTVGFARSIGRGLSRNGTPNCPKQFPGSVTLRTIVFDEDVLCISGTEWRLHEELT